MHAGRSGSVFRSCGQRVLRSGTIDRMEIRAPRPDDAPGLGEVHVRAWQVGYRGVMPDEYLDGLSVEDRTRMWVEVLAREPRVGAQRLLAEADGRVVGFAAAGPEVGAEAPTVGELAVLNVHPDWWGRGVGPALLAAATDHLAEAWRHAILWVATGNARGRRFYEREGWHADGESRTDEVFGITVDEVRYARDLG